MESVLEVYERKLDSNRPVLCFDERPCQLIEDVLMPVPVSPGKEKREDYHYKRNGTCVVFLAIEPLSGRRIVEVRKRKTKKDYALFMRKMSLYYKDVDKITLIQDNLNTHNGSSFYENMPAQKALELKNRLEMIYTPKKASWLNMAEIEFSALSKQCLNRRIGSFEQLKKEVETWTRKRNKDRIKINWQFTNNKARNKFKRHYENIKI